MNYIDQGFDQYLTRSGGSPGMATGGMAAPFFSQDINESLLDVSGSKITSGLSKSKDGYFKISWDTGTLRISDGTKEFFLLGKLDDGSRGLKLLDSKGNIISISMIELNVGGTVVPGQTNTARLFVDRNPNNGKNRVRVQFSNGDPLTIASQL